MLFTTQSPPLITQQAAGKTHYVARSIASYLLSFGLFLTGVGGAFAPWIWRESVALQLTAPGLAEFVKFLPEVRLGQVQIQRLFFLLPLFLAMLALPLFIENKSLHLPMWLRWTLRLAVLPLALASLSPVWTPAILIAPEFRWQTLLTLLAIGLAVIASLFKSLPLNVLVIFLIVGGIAALILPFWQFSLIQAAMADAYRQPVSLGWGWWLAVGGIGLSMAAGVWQAFLIERAKMTTLRTVLLEHTLPTGQIMRVMQGDITAETTEAIVNAANEHLQHGGGVAGAISRTGGPAIQQESNEWVRRYGRVPTGSAAITSAGKLAAKYVIHAVGPVWGSGDDEVKLASAVTSALALAASCGVKSIALPGISSGIFGGPKDICARVIIQAVLTYFQQNSATSLAEVNFCNIDEVTASAFLAEAKKLFNDL